MTRVCRLLLLVAALAGLVGQPAAFAAVPMTGGASQMASMGEECDDMSAMSTDQSAPCENMTRDCAATMGCATPPVIVVNRAAGSDTIRAAVRTTWPAILPLAGRTLSPEPYPPSSLLG